MNPDIPVCSFMGQREGGREGEGEREQEKERKEKTRQNTCSFPQSLAERTIFYFKSNSILLHQRSNIILQTTPLLTILECKLSGDRASPSTDNPLCNTMPNTAGNIEMPSCYSMSNFQTFRPHCPSDHIQTGTAQKNHTQGFIMAYTK
jgi:hypothetical protein